jgi:hypothetical protein
MHVDIMMHKQCSGYITHAILVLGDLIDEQLHRNVVLENSEQMISNRMPTRILTHREKGACVQHLLEVYIIPPWQS